MRPQLCIPLYTGRVPQRVALSSNLGARSAPPHFKLRNCGAVIRRIVVKGLLDMAFDPEFSDNGFFYLSHSVGLGAIGSLGQVTIRLAFILSVVSASAQVGFQKVVPWMRAGWRSFHECTQPTVIFFLTSMYGTRVPSADCTKDMESVGVPCGRCPCCWGLFPIDRSPKRGQKYRRERGRMLLRRVTPSSVLVCGRGCRVLHQHSTKCHPDPASLSDASESHPVGALD